MKLETYYHLYETAHSGLLDEPVNLVPESWNRFTVTDGSWMTSATLDALCYRDLFLAQQIQIVDKDKKQHYIAGDWITIDSETYTISFTPTQYNYYFTDGLHCNEDYNYVSLPLPDTFNTTDSRPDKYKVNKIELKTGGLYYGFTPQQSHIVPPVETIVHYVPSNSAGIVNKAGAVTTFPSDANVVIVSASTLETFDEYYEYNRTIGKIDSWTANIGAYVANGRLTSSYDVSSEDGDSHTNTSSNIFNPNDRTQFNGVTGYSPSLEGGLNYICGDVDMVPSGVLFIYE